MSAAIMIVDDSLTVRMDLTEAFQAEGMHAIGCETLAAARMALATGSVGLVILDVLLPDGNGVDLAQQIRADPTLKSVPILMLSTEAEVQDRIRGLVTGSDDYIGKPYDRQYVIARARELLSRNDAAALQPKITVLVIEDSITFRAELCEALRAHGYEVLSAASGEEGLRSAVIRRPTAVIVNGALPGIDGATVVRKLRLDEALRKTPCVLLTGSASDFSAELNALDAGADAFVSKEEKMEVVLARVAAVLRTASGAEKDRETASLLGPKKILAVDDSPTYLEELVSILRGEGYDVIPARSGEEALKMLAVQPVDCILLDLLMPGLGGTETCRRIKDSPATRDTPLVMLTANENRDAMIEGLSTGADDYVLKSSEDEVLKARVRAQLRRKQIEDESRRIRLQLLRKELEANEARAARRLAETKAALAEELEQKNRALAALNHELEAFSYSVSHDLRAPLRSIDGFSAVLFESCNDRIDEQGRHCLNRIRESAQHMSRLIDDLLALSRVTRHDLCVAPVDLSNLAHKVIERLRAAQPQRHVECVIDSELTVIGDAGLLEVALGNLLGNAWKFTGKREDGRIEFGQQHQGGSSAFFVRDNGAGFDMCHADMLFGVFQRLHTSAQFEGTGVGLAIVQRVIQRHEGRIWAESIEGQGATFYFTLSKEQGSHDSPIVAQSSDSCARRVSL